MRPQIGLACARSSRSVTRHVTRPPDASGLRYIRGTVASPVCLAVAVFAGCIGLGYAGMIGAALAVLAVVTLGASSARARCVRAYVDEQARARARASRECQRIRRLRPTGATRQQHYNELRLLVEEVERTDPGEAARFELQDLLDHFIGMAISHQRCVDALRMAGANALPPTTPIGDVTRGSRRRDILQRRVRHRDECLRRMEKLTDEIEAIDQLVRLVVQRTASIHVEADLDRELDRRLWELDEVDAALRQLSA
jgi:hypothetical protein